MNTNVNKTSTGLNLNLNLNSDSDFMETFQARQNFSPESIFPTSTTNSTSASASVSASASTAASAVLSLAFRNFFSNLTDWQKSSLFGVSTDGVKCLLEQWFQQSTNPIQGPHCNATWDEIYCWPATLGGQNASRSCSEVMKGDPAIPNADEIVGDAYRICSSDGTWLWGNWTNYNACLEGISDFTPAPGSATVDLSLLTVRYIYFIGSILSFCSLILSLSIYYYFKNLRCDRITVIVHLMVSLAFRSVLMIVITEPFIFQRTTNYRTVDWVCKTVLALQLYATVASISWMFVQGHYLHARVTTNVFDRGTPFKTYFSVGYGVPLILICVWVWIMETHHPVHCWKKYGKLDYIWLLVGPMIFALVVNLLFLVNIMRILLTKIQLASISSDSVQFRRAVKASAVLLPLLGITNLLFLYNPGGNLEAAYMITNTILQSSQGLVVSTLYCFISKEVTDSVRREYRKFTIKRSATSVRRSTRHRDRRSSYNPTCMTNSVYSDNPSTFTSCRHSIHRRASTIISKIKPSSLLQPQGIPGGIGPFSQSSSMSMYSPTNCNGNGNGIETSPGSGIGTGTGTGTGTCSSGRHLSITWTSNINTSINILETTPPSETSTINILQPYAAVMYNNTHGKSNHSPYWYNNSKIELGQSHVDIDIDNGDPSGSASASACENAKGNEKEEKEVDLLRVRGNGNCADSASCSGSVSASGPSESENNDNDNDYDNDTTTENLTEFLDISNACPIPVPENFNLEELDKENEAGET